MKLLQEEDPGSVIDLLLTQRAQELRDEIARMQSQLDLLDSLQQGLKETPDFSIESIPDMATNMEARKKLKRVHTLLLVTGLPFSLLQLAGIILWIVTGNWWLFAIWAVLVIPAGILLSRMYFGSVAYICPGCHETFRPELKEAFFADHTPYTRKLTCTCCGHKGFCVETWGGDNKG